MKRKVFVIFTLMAILVNGEKLDENTDIQTTYPTEKNHEKDLIKISTEKKTDQKEVHKRGIYHREPFISALSLPSSAHFAATSPQAAFWPKTYAAHYGYNVRSLGVPAFSPTILKQKQIFASPGVHSTPYVLRPGGASVSSYSATYPRYQSKHAYSLAQPIQPVLSIQPAIPAPAIHPQFVQTSFVSPQPAPEPIQQVVPLQPAISAPHPHQHFIQTSFIPSPSGPDCISQVLPVQPAIAASPPHQHFVQTSFVPPQPAPGPIFSSSPALPEFPPIAFAPETIIPQIPQFPQQPHIPEVPKPPTIPQPPPPVNFIFPLHIQPPRPQPPPSFVNTQLGVDFPNFIPISNNPPPDTGSAVASPQIPAPQPPNTPAIEHQQPEFPNAQLPAVENETPWRPLYTPPSNSQRPTITLQPPYSSPSNAYLPPDASQNQQELQFNHLAQQHQQLQQHNEYNDGISDDEIAHIFQQSKYVPHHSLHLSRYHH